MINIITALILVAGVANEFGVRINFHDPWPKILVTAGLLLIAGLANGIGDRIKFHNPWPRSKFWSADSWRNVYKNGDPSQGRKFVGSTSWLAFLCDGWHLMKFIAVESLSVALAINTPYPIYYSYPVIRTLFFIGFKITYR